MTNSQEGQCNLAVVRMLERIADVISETEIEPGHLTLIGDTLARCLSNSEIQDSIH